MKQKIKKMLRARTRKQASGDKSCRYADVISDKCVRCSRDGSMRKSACPCIRYEGRLRERVRVAVDFIIFG